MPNFSIKKSYCAGSLINSKKLIDSYDLAEVKLEESFVGSFPIEDVEWNIGVIVGNSGTGKSTIARECFGDSYFTGHVWSDKPVIEEIAPQAELGKIVKCLSNVGFSTIPSYLKPYSALSTGEKMRVDIARCLLNSEFIVFDEFTSVVDRSIAKCTSFAISKAVRKERKKFIACTCHRDIIEYLEPDWIFDTDRMEWQYTRGLLRRPGIKISIHRCDRKLWGMFRKYHYMNTDIYKSATCFVGVHEGKPVVFMASINMPSRHSSRRIKVGHRLVVLPDYQGIGLGHAFSTWVAKHFMKQGIRYRITSSSKPLAKQRIESAEWVLESYGHQRILPGGAIKSRSSKRVTHTFEYVGKLDKKSRNRGQ